MYDVQMYIDIILLGSTLPPSMKETEALDW